MAGKRGQLHRFKAIRTVLRNTPEYQIQKIINHSGINGEDADMIRERYIQHIPAKEIAEKHHMSYEIYRRRSNVLMLKIRKSILDLDLDTDTVTV